jgi:hypothetical protein
VKYCGFGFNISLFLFDRVRRFRIGMLGLVPSERIERTYLGADLYKGNTSAKGEARKPPK